MMRRSLWTRPRRVEALAVSLLLTCLNAGCGGADSPSPLSPTVSADSEEGKRALDQDRQLRAERQKQEADLRRRNPRLPAVK